MRVFNLLVIMLFAGTASAAPLGGSSPNKGIYPLDAMHSKIGFEIPHLVISSVEGQFRTFTGAIEAGETLSALKLHAVVEVGSIDTGVDKRDEHLRSSDFFDAAQFPKITFKSAQVSGTADNLKITGDLTIKGITKSVALTGKYLGTVQDASGNKKIALNAKTKINRKDFALNWNKLVEAGPVVGDEVSIDLKFQAALTTPEKSGK